jgi:DNA-binding GntR family transcriptional regulator
MGFFERDTVVVVALESHSASRIPRLSIERLATAERVADALRGSITNGELPPGSRLPEAALVEALGVSRNTLREAFRLLARENLVMHELHRGVVVKRLTELDVHEIYRVRLVLETAAVDRTANLDRARLAPVREVVSLEEVARDAGDWPAVATHDIAFHRRLVELLDSARLNAYFAALLAELRLAFAIPTDPSEFLGPFIPRNRKIAELLESGHRRRCVEELASYLADAEELLLRLSRTQSENAERQIRVQSVSF